MLLDSEGRIRDSGFQCKGLIMYMQAIMKFLIRLAILVVKYFKNLLLAHFIIYSGGDHETQFRVKLWVIAITKKTLTSN